MSILVADLGGVEVLFSKIAQEVWKIARDMIFHFIVISGGKKSWFWLDFSWVGPKNTVDSQDLNINR